MDPGWREGNIPARMEGRTAPSIRVERVMGIPTFTLDSKPFLNPCFETYAPRLKYFRQFTGAGTRLFSFSANAASCDYGHSAPTWVDEDSFDYGQFERRVQRVLEADPRAFILPRVYIGTPRWWLEKNPREPEVLDDGSTLYREPNRNPTLPGGRTFPSLASKKWREHTALTTPARRGRRSAGKARSHGRR